MRSLLRYPGSKWNLAKRIIDLAPEHRSYLEPYFGSGAVFFNKPQSAIETINDLSDDVVNLFQVIKNNPEELSNRLFYIPYSRTIYDKAWELDPKDELEKATNFIIKSVMSHGFRTIEKSGWKNDIAGREKSYAVRHWNSLPELVQRMALRLKDAQIENREAIDLIQRFDYSNVFIYVDPPYVLLTRARKQYSFEMSDKDHEELLETLNASRAKIILSGYDNELYRRNLSNWERLEFAATAEKGLKMTEVLWLNYEVNKQISLL